MKGIKWSIIIILFVLIVFVGCICLKSDDKLIVPEGHMEYGILDENCNIINSGSVIKGNKIKHSFRISHNLNYKRDYMLLALMDFKQKEFKINGVMHKSYYLNLNKVDSKKIDIEIENDGGSELDYVILQFPSCKKIDEGDFEKALKIQNVFALRFNLDQKRTLEENEYENEKIIKNAQIMESLAFAKEVGEFKILTQIKSGEDIFVTLGNNENKKTDYALILIKDCNQVEFEDGNYVKYQNLDSKELSYFKLHGKTLELDSNYQLLAFPLPFKVSMSDYFSQSIFATNRISVN